MLKSHIFLPSCLLLVILRNYPLSSPIFYHIPKVKFYTKIRSLVAAAAIAFSAFSSVAQNNIVEEVAWMIGDQPIYKSEIEDAYQEMLFRRVAITGDPYCFVPENLAIEKLFLHQADIDTIDVPLSQVMSSVEQTINNYVTQFGSKEKVEEYFRKPLPELREQLAQDMRNNYRVQQVQRTLTDGIKSTPSDVRRYFNSLPADSIPSVPTLVEVQIITLNPAIPRQEIEDVKARLRNFADQVNNGEQDFSTLAILYSEDRASATHGGEIGFMGRGTLEPEYAAVAFNLNDPKKSSRVVETTFGYHIIQLIEKRGDRVNTRHILLQPKVSDEDLRKSLARLDSIRTDIVDGKFTFEDAAILSQDKDTRKNRGIMFNKVEDGGDGTSRWEMSQLPQEVAIQVSNLQPGEISKPFIMKDNRRSRDIVAIVKLTNRIDAHKANFADDFQLIKNMYENSLREKKIKDWLSKKIADTYVKIEDGWADCDFRYDWTKIKK